jgi:hypothetical protein
MAPYAADDQVPSLGGAEQPHFFALGQATTEQPTIQHIVYCSVLGFTPTWNYYDQQVIGTGTTTCQQAVEVIRIQVCIQKRLHGTSSWGSPVCGPVHFLTTVRTISRSFRVYCTRGATYDYRTYAIGSATHDGVTSGSADPSDSYVVVGTSCI